ncbi:MAG: hypothetical protein V1928_02505 [Parcubacteria group bacterium]
MPNALEQSILKTVAYFDLFNFPLTSWEIKKYLYSPDQAADFIQINQALSGLKNKFLESQEGFYFLKGRSNIVGMRKRRYLIADRKLRRARPYVYLIGKLPFVKAVFICNNLAYRNAPGESDIDLAIITANGSAWSARFFAAALMKLLCRRPTERTTRDRICLSFFVDEDSLELKRLSYPDDIHFAYWVGQFMPVFDPENYAERFFKANEWIKKFLPNIFSIKENYSAAGGTNSRAKINFPGGGILEKILHKFQLLIMPKRILEKASQGNTDVVLGNGILKFHTKDRRLAVKQEWEEKIRKLSIENQK